MPPQLNVGPNLSHGVLLRNGLIELLKRFLNRYTSQLVSAHCIDFTVYDEYKIWICRDSVQFHSMSKKPCTMLIHKYIALTHLHCDAIAKILISFSFHLIKRKVWCCSKQIHKLYWIVFWRDIYLWYFKGFLQWEV